MTRKAKVSPIIVLTDIDTTSDKDIVYFRIARQLLSRGDQIPYSDYETGITISSSHYPEWHKGLNTLYVLGSLYTKDYISIKMPTDRFLALKKAIPRISLSYFGVKTLPEKWKNFGGVNYIHSTVDK